MRLELVKVCLSSLLTITRPETPAKLYFRSRQRDEDTFIRKQQQQQQQQQQRYEQEQKGSYLAPRWMANTGKRRGWRWKKAGA